MEIQSDRLQKIYWVFYSNWHDRLFALSPKQTPADSSIENMSGEWSIANEDRYDLLSNVSTQYLFNSSTFIFVSVFLVNKQFWKITVLVFFLQKRKMHKSLNKTVYWLWILFWFYVQLQVFVCLLALNIVFVLFTVAGVLILYHSVHKANEIRKL